MFEVFADVMKRTGPFSQQSSVPSSTGLEEHKDVRQLRHLREGVDAGIGRDDERLARDAALAKGRHQLRQRQPGHPLFFMNHRELGVGPSLGGALLHGAMYVELVVRRQGSIRITHQLHLKHTLRRALGAPRTLAHPAQRDRYPRAHQAEEH